MWTALLLLELLGEDIRSLDLRMRDKELLGSREERLGNFTVYVSFPPFLILEGVKDAKRCRPWCSVNLVIFALLEAQLRGRLQS